MNHDPFYVGYASHAPPLIARFVKRWVILLGFITVLLAALLVMAQNPFARTVFEYGQVRSFTGTLITKPAPILFLDVPSAPQNLESVYLLTIFGKSGAEEAVAAFDGHRVTLEGTLIQRAGRSMIEILPDKIMSLGPSTHQPLEPSAREPVRLRGEIIDSKCYLGVMKPGHLKPHRSCAIRCISGGVPPALMVRHEDEHVVYYLLVDEQGRSLNKEILTLVAKPVQISGFVSRLGSLRILKARRQDIVLIQ